MSESRKEQMTGSDPQWREEVHAVPVRPGGRPFHAGLPTGTGLGKYHILERIRTTHNAAVYKARDSMLDRLVAIKQMSPELIDNPIACGLFKREAQLMALVPKDARNIVGIHELIEDDHGLFIVEEYVPGHWLEMLISKRQIDMAGAVRILRTAAQGLQTLHNRSIVHRHVQPNDIIVARNGSAKVANLSAAAHEGDTSWPPVITARYAAPELLLDQDYDARIDLYSLGMVLFEVCVGRRACSAHFADVTADPSMAVSRWTAWHTDFDACLPEASELNPRVPPALSSIIRRMTAKSLDDRYTTIRDVIDALSQHFADRKTGEAPPARFLPAKRPEGALGHCAAGPVPARRLLPAPIVASSRLSPPLSTSTHAVRPCQPDPSSAWTPDAPSDEGAKTIAPKPIRPHHHHSRQQPPFHAPRAAVPSRPIPAPKPVIEVLKRRHAPLIRWAVAAAILLGVIGGGGAAWWYYRVGPGGTHPIASLIADADAAYEHGGFAMALAKFREATRMDVRRREFVGLRSKAERWVPMAESQLALEQNKFDQALERLSRAENRGVNRAKASELWQRIWNKKDLYRLEAEGQEDLTQGRFARVEQKLGEYEEKANAIGANPTELRDRLDTSRRKQKYTEAIERAEAALAEGNHDEAYRSCAEAEGIRVTRETRMLRSRVKFSKKQAALLLLGDEAMMEKDYETAADAYIEANQTQPSLEIEKKARLARALVLFGEAQVAIGKGELLTAEQKLKNSMWQFPTREARSLLKAKAPAFEAAKLVRKADRAAERGDYAEARRLYADALRRLPPPADAAARKKLLQAQRSAALSQGEQAAKRGDWEAASQAFEKLRAPGRDDEHASHQDDAETDRP